MELKSRWRKYSPNFTIHDYQVNEFRDDSKDQFWAFLLYDIRHDIDNHRWRIRDREVWCIPWEYADDIPVSVTPRERYRYVHGTDFPYALATIPRPGGILHVPRGSVLEERLEKAKKYKLSL